MPDILVSVSAGVFGAVGAGFVSCGLGALLWRKKREPFVPVSPTLVVLIPVHQEENDLPGTILSVRAAADTAGLPVRVLVGADSCTDRSAEIARSLGAGVTEFSYRSKWKTLAMLAKEAKGGDWVALVDAGAVWPRELLLDLADSLRDPELLGIAPAYFPRNASWFERALWKIEAGCKRAENIAGGPVSAHGATIFFRGEVLAAAFAYLGKLGFEAWLNDDVALPFSARMLFPGARLFYWCPSDPERCISDSGLREKEPQFGRRRRMVIGNFQWIVSLWPRSFLCAPAAGALAVRRIARVFWAYWGLCLLYAACFAILGTRPEALLATAVSAAAFAALLWMAGMRGFVEAAFASFAAPFLFPLGWRAGAQRWS